MPGSKCHVDMTLPIHVNKVVQKLLWRNGPNVDRIGIRKLVLKCSDACLLPAIEPAIGGRKYCSNDSDYFCAPEVRSNPRRRTAIEAGQ